IRARLVTFLREPLSADDHASYTYEEDGAVLVEDGIIRASGSHGDVVPLAPDAEVVDHRPHLVLPGFVDAHAHFVQMQVIASYGAELLDWLNNYTFPEEARFRDQAHAARIAGLFLD